MVGVEATLAALSKAKPGALARAIDKGKAREQAFLESVKGEYKPIEPTK